MKRMALPDSIGAACCCHLNGRAGYERRNLVAIANILAQNGQQQACEEVLAAVRTSGSERQIDSTLPLKVVTAPPRSGQHIDIDEDPDLPRSRVRSAVQTDIKH